MKITLNDIETIESFSYLEVVAQQLSNGKPIIQNKELPIYFGEIENDELNIDFLIICSDLQEAIEKENKSNICCGHCYWNKALVEFQNESKVMNIGSKVVILKKEIKLQYKNKNKVIDLTKILSHLPENKIKELETITRRIIDAGKAEIVVLFGSYARGNYKEIRGETQGKKSDYDILVVASGYATKRELSSDLRETFKDISVPVQLIVETIDFVNSNLEEKQFFFTDIKREGKVLYNFGNFELSDSKELTPKRRRKIAEEDFKQWYNDATKAYKGAKFYLSEKDFGWASFMLQQVVEMCYTAIEMVFTHYNPYEHNLKTLLRRTLQFDSRIKEVLPYNTIEEQELFDDLNFAYIGGRYRSEEEFPITKKQLDYWSKEAKKLLELTEKICQERIDCLKEIERKS